MIVDNKLVDAIDIWHLERCEVMSLKEPPGNKH
jgi:hypothetical protein